MAEIQLKGATKSFDKAAEPVVDRVDLVIDEGEFVVLLGPSGCGKTTTLRLIAGLEKLTSGELRFDGRLMNDVPGDQRNVGMVFQNYALYPHMSVFDNLAFGMRSRGASRSETKRRVAEVAEILELDDLLKRRPRELSGGQRQRVALGRALVRRPAVFLMDEPLSNLDANLREQTRMELARLHARLGITTVYVTHDQSEALTLADRVVVMDGGRVRQVARPAAVYAEPADAFVARFIGSPGMNLWRLLWHDGGEDLACGEAVRLPRHLLDCLGTSGHGELTVGVRPEHLKFDAEDTDATISCRVELQEHLGSHVHLHARLGLSGEGQRLVARIPPELTFAPGAHLRLAAPLRALHLFDPVSGERIGPAARGTILRAERKSQRSRTQRGDAPDAVVDGVAVG